MHLDGSYYHYRGKDEPPQLYGYLPAQLWPAAAWWAYHAATGDARAAQRGNVLLAQIAAYEVPALAGFTERLDAALSPWAESRSHAVLAWLLAGTPPRYAVIDTGTNSIKFHVGERAADGSWRAVVDRTLQPFAQQRQCDRPLLGERAAIEGRQRRHQRA